MQRTVLPVSDMIEVLERGWFVTEVVVEDRI